MCPSKKASPSSIRRLPSSGRVSELAGLKWNDVIAIEQVSEEGEVEVRYAISIDERFCRGDWGAPKSDASNATIGINECVYLRIQRLKLLTVNVRAGNAIRRYKVVKAAGPMDLVFQSVSKGAPMRDNNILSRHIKPAARKMGLGFVNWRCLRTSHATWLKLAGGTECGRARPERNTKTPAVG